MDLPFRDNVVAFFSRNGVTSPFGKLDARIEAFRIDSATKDRFAQIATEEGRPANEFLRDVMRIICWGPEKVKSMQGQEVDEVVRLLAGLNGANNHTDLWKD